MKQILQNLKNGEVKLEELPVPRAQSGTLLIKTTNTLVSLGTEKMLLQFGKAGWINKARQQPEKVKQVLNKIKTDGLVSTVNTVMNKLDQPISLGYSNVGVVIGVGANVHGFEIGDRVLSNGPHAEVVMVPENLCAKIPDSVSNETAAFTVVASIGLQGIRLASPTMGETFVVTGLGLIGILTVQLLKANGCRVIGFDFDAKKVQAARDFGAEAFVITPEFDPVGQVMALTNQYGADGVIITASTQSNDPISQAPQMCRKRGRVVLVGVIGLNLSRADFYEKEISFQVSCSYGPGRYEEDYEKKGYDYPIGFVRWTENRNFQAVLSLMEERRIQTDSLISRTVELSEAPDLYSSLGANKDDLGIMIKYSGNIEEELRTVSLGSSTKKSVSKVVAGIIGAGNFAGGTILPELRANNVRMKYISSKNGVTASHKGKKFGVEKITSDHKEILRDEEVNTIFICTPHSTHGVLVLEALKAGKNVFVEKPLALNLEEVEAIEEFQKNNKGGNVLLVGFNRRFSPLVKKIKELVGQEEKMAIAMNINAGFIPSNHWTQDLQVGGGRLIGEGCHFLDLARFIAGSEVAKASIAYADMLCRDTFSVSLTFKNGSLGIINYFSNGHKSFPKERVEIYCGEKNLVLDNFNTLKGYGFKKFKSMSLSKQDKGHHNEIKEFIEGLEKNQQLIQESEIFEISKLVIELHNKETSKE